MKNSYFWLFIFGAFLIFTSYRAQAACLALTDATAYLPDGKTEGVTLILDGDRLTAVGTGIELPPGCATLSVKGKVVTPGLVDPATLMGLVEVELEPNTVDSAPGKETQHIDREVHPAFRVSDAYNPLSTLIPIARIAGITSTITLPRGGTVHGQSAWVDLAGATQAETVINTSLAVHASVRGTDGSRAVALSHIRHLLEEARAFTTRKKQWETRRSRDFDFSASDLKAMEPVLRRKIPLVVRTDRASDMEALLRIGAEFNIRLVFVGAAEGWRMAEELAARHVAVILDPLVYSGRSFDQLHGKKSNAVILHKAGVDVMLSSFETHNVRTLPQVAGNAVRAGLSHEAAIRAITETPAKVFGMKNHGRLAQGAIANLVIWSGDPLELSTTVEKVFIHGKDVVLESRQTLLRDRYLKQFVPPALPLP